MAGFAVFMAFLTWGFVLFIIAIVLSIVLHRIAKCAHLKSGTAARRYRLTSILAPFFGLLWLVIAIVLHVMISNRFAHQSVGFSPDPYVTLPNGFKLGSHNTYDGYIVAPGYQTDVPVTGPGYVRSIIDVAWEGDAFRGSFFDFRSSTKQNFVFNTKTLQIQINPAGPLTWNAANDSAQSGSQSYWVIYKQYRHRWPTGVFWALLILGEGFIAWSLFHLRRKAISQIAT